MTARGLAPALEDKNKMQNLLQSQRRDLQFISSGLHSCCTPSGGFTYHSAAPLGLTAGIQPLIVAAGD